MGCNPWGRKESDMTERLSTGQLRFLTAYFMFECFLFVSAARNKTQEGRKFCCILW